MIRIALLVFIGAALAATTSGASEPPRPTLIFDEMATDVAPSDMATGDLWVTLPDLTRATKFQLKPEGVCTEKLCFPIPAGRKDEFLSERMGNTWFNLSAFARLLKQPAARDEKNNVWYFGPRPEAQDGYFASLIAPDFTLPDLQGKPHSLSDFRGKKVMLITWASW